MKRSKLTLLKAALACGTAVAVTLPAPAANVFLSVESFTKTLPGGKEVLMWGYRLDTDGNFATVEGSATSPGPAIVVPPGDPTLTITLKNGLAPDPLNPALNVATSIVIPGQNGFVRNAPHSAFTDSQGRVRARSFVKETAPGAVVTYTWTNVTAGTYLYHSGSHAALQVQMGLFGAVTKNSSATQVYPGKVVAGQVTLLLSEIDTKVHEAVQNHQYGPGLAMSSTIKSVPDYFLINGDAYPDATFPLSVTRGQTVLVRLLNAGYNERVPVLNGQHLTFIAEDGRLYPGPREQYAPVLPALKTMDGLWTAPGTAGEVVVYDRRLGLANGLTPDGGMIKKISIN